MLEQFLAAHDVEVAFYLGVFLCEAVDFLLGEAAAEAGVEFAGELGGGISEDTHVYGFLGLCLLGSSIWRGVLRRGKGRR